MKKISWQGQTFWLHPHRLMYWEEEKILIGSDLHLGKIGHFRKAGIALPQQAYKEDLHRLFSALQYFQPRQFLVVGDLFHSKANKELDWFLRWRADLCSINFTLIRGNHDLLSDQWYHENGIQVFPSHTSKGLHFVHDPAEEKQNQQRTTSTRQDQVETMVVQDKGLATISGHIHPGVRLHGFARQSVQLPCFYFSVTQCILPAFGQFTGLYTIHPQAGDNVFALLNNEIFKL